jgi:hypothetical protein
MALLAAADLAVGLCSREPLLVEMSERGTFESMPDHGARVVSVTRSTASSIAASWRAIATPRRSCRRCWMRYLLDPLG